MKSVIWAGHVASPPESHIPLSLGFYIFFPLQLYKPGDICEVPLFISEALFWGGWQATLGTVAPPWWRLYPKSGYSLLSSLGLLRDTRLETSYSAGPVLALTWYGSLTFLNKLWSQIILGLSKGSCHKQLGICTCFEGLVVGVDVSDVTCSNCRETKYFRVF